MDLKEIGELGILRAIRKWMPSSAAGLIRGIGDDVAVIDLGDEKTLLVTTDLLIEDVDFKRSWIDPFRLGRKALSVNLSDIAAMGGTPSYFLLSLGLPGNLPLAFVATLYRGLRREATRFGVTLIGGDLSLSEKITLNLCLLGKGKKGKLVFRDGAKPGDALYVSGTLGDSALGLRILQKEGLKGEPKGLIQRHLCPTPRVELGQAIAGLGLATSMIDISDGLLRDTNHLLEESGAGARLWEERIPVSRLYSRTVLSYAKDFYDPALSGGEDFELLFTAPPAEKDRIRRLSLSLKVPITCIGEVLPRNAGLLIAKKDGSESSPSRLGYEHFT